MDGVEFAGLDTVAQTDAAELAGAGAAEEVLDGGAGLVALIVHFGGRIVAGAGAHDFRDSFFGRAGFYAQNCRNACSSAGAAGNALIGCNGMVLRQSRSIVVAAYVAAGAAVRAWQAFADLHLGLVHGNREDLRGDGEQNACDQAGDNGQQDRSYKSRCS